MTNGKYANTTLSLNYRIMEAKELRIGNIIQHKESKYKTSVTARVLYLANMDYYEGIPLTEEWLVKFGYYKESESNTCEWWKRPHKTVSLKYFKEESMWKYAVNRLKLKHVHQLQNLVHALTGEELTIK